MHQLPLAKLLVGFERFHCHPFVNEKLNRAHALSFAYHHELCRAAGEVQR